MKMKASICTRYGSADVLQIHNIDKPIPKANEILVKIHASSITAADSMMRQGSPYYGRLFLGLTKPKVPISGTGFAGTVEALGNEVSLFKVGDDVFGESIFGAGTNAEYVCVAEDVVVLTKPQELTHAQAATLCDGALTSINMLKNLGEINAGDNVLINAASGSLGSAGIQIAKALGAQVTAVCSAANVDMVKQLGADHVIDYTINDFTNNENCYDIIYDSIGNRKYSDCAKALTHNGRYVSPALALPLLGQVIWTALKAKIKPGKSARFGATGLLPTPKLKELLSELLPMITAKKLTPIIDRYYALEDISTAHKYIDTGRKKGNIVIQVV
jgi:NADPH:quinone reductase-like Zn-dependent oxidoreductase